MVRHKPEQIILKKIPVAWCVNWYLLEILFFFTHVSSLCKSVYYPRAMGEFRCRRMVVPCNATKFEGNWVGVGTLAVEFSARDLLVYRFILTLCVKDSFYRLSAYYSSLDSLTLQFWFRLVPGGAVPPFLDLAIWLDLNSPDVSFTLPTSTFRYITSGLRWRMKRRKTTLHKNKASENWTGS
jgi:hypothetical protein